MLKRKLQKGFSHFRNLSKTAHKSYVLVLLEVIYWILIRKGSYSDYMDFQLYLKGRKMADYLAPDEFKAIEKKLNSPGYYSILEDKYFFYKVLEGNGFRSPRNLYLIDTSGIYDLESREFISRESFLQRELDGFCKIINGYGGGKIYRLEIKGAGLLLNKEPMDVSDFLKLLGNDKYMIQERIVQHAVMDELNPSCVNTIRMLTIRTGQTTHLLEDYLRIGINNSYVDNGSSGNIITGIREDGRLLDLAYSSGIESATYTMDTHPQTGVRFSDFTIPCYKEAVAMVKDLHQHYQQFFMVGWDIGLSPDGPIVIEGNNIVTLYSYQLIYGGMRTAFKDLARSYEEQLTLYP